jgi:curved DNA-binding protein CbpA
MLLKKSTAALYSNVAVCSSLCSSSTITSSCPLRVRSTALPSPLRKPPCQSRNYASVEHERFDKDGKDRTQPQWPASPNPTPYEILSQTKNTPYNKLQFYELVKLYHPDRHHISAISSDAVPHLTRLERYHLVVAANDILSDPEKRRLYDISGAGWGAEPDMQSKYRDVDRKWRQEPGNASMNATWEDWERWHQERDENGNRKKQEPLYMSNGGFVGIIVLFLLIGGWGQATRAGRHSDNLLDMRDKIHGSASQELRKRQSEAARLSRQGRVESFLRQREGWEYDQPGPVRLSNGAQASSSK